MYRLLKSIKHVDDQLFEWGIMVMNRRKQYVLGASGVIGDAMRSFLQLPWMMTLLLVNLFETMYIYI